jgi:hypothetical protein
MRRTTPRWLLAAACWSGLFVAGPGSGKAAAQYRGIRFEITLVGDTTFGFSRGEAAWVRRGVTGIAVDPRRRDALVARFLVTSVDTGFVTALITGQATRVSTEHIVILEEPRRPWYRTVTFWAGTAVGALLGALVASR